ncbi:MAG: hypothetical protein AAGJ94_13890 [Pseudomonadota bacterium]
MGQLGRAFFFALAVAIGLGGFVLTGARMLERSNTAVAEAQYDYVLARAEGAMERGLQLGLPLRELEQALPVLERTINAAPQVLAADVFSPSGVTLFSTDRGAMGEPVPPPWLVAIDERRGETWQEVGRHQVTMGRAVVNDFGLVEGWAALIVDRDALTTPFSLALPILRDGLLIIFAAALGAALIGAVDSVGVKRRTRDAIAILTEEPTTKDHSSHGDPFIDAVEAAAAATRATHHQLSAATSKMQTLDAEV